MQPDEKFELPKWIALAPPSLFLFILAASSGFDLIPELGVFNAKRLLQPLTMGAALLLCLFNRELRSAYADQCARVPGLAIAGITAVLLLGLISALRFPHPAYGVADVTLLALIAVSIPLIAASRQLAGTVFDRWVLFLLAMLGLVVAATELTGLVAGWSLDSEFGFNEMLVRFAHPRLYNQLQSWMLPVLAAIPLVFAKSRKNQLLAVMLLGLQWLIVLISGARGSFLALTIGLTVIVLLVYGDRRQWLPTHLLGLVLGLVMFAGVLGGHSLMAPAGGEFLEKSVGRSMTHSTGRTLLWKLALEDAKTHPLLGAGPMRFNCDGPGAWPAHPHSFPMRLLSEWGIPVFIMVFALFCWAAFQVATHLRSGKGTEPQIRGLHAMLAAGALAASLHACLSGVLTMPASQMMAVIICGWLLALTPTARPGKPSQASRLVPATLVAAVLACLVLSVFNISELRQYSQRVEELSKAGPVQPRYWQHGRACLYGGY